MQKRKRGIPAVCFIHIYILSRYDKVVVKELNVKLEEEKQKDIDKKMQERRSYAQMRTDRETLKVEREKQQKIEKDKDKKFIEEYNNMIEDHHKNRVGNKSNVILNAKIFITPNSKINSSIKIGKDPKIEMYHDKLEQTQPPKKIDKFNRNENSKIANSFETKNIE